MVGEVYRLYVESGFSSDLMLKIDFGDSFKSLFYSQIHPYDFSELYGAVNEEELIALKFLTEKNLGTFLDVGAGVGRISTWLQENNCDVTACDIDPWCVEECTKNGIKKIVSTSYTELDEQFDCLIVFGRGIPMLTEEENLREYLVKFLNSLKKLLKPNGFILLDTLNYSPIYKGDPKYKVSRMITSFGDVKGPSEYYIYPYRTEVFSITEEVGLTYDMEWIHLQPRAGKALNYRWISIWQAKETPSGSFNK